MHKMKIAYCIAGTYNSGGMERVLANKANWLVNHGHEVFVITTDQRGQQPFFELSDRISCFDLSINYEENNGKSFLNKLISFPFKQHRHKKRLTKLLNDIRPDITISMFCNEVTFLPLIKDGSKKILEIHFCRYKRLQYNRRGLWRIADVYRCYNEKRLIRKYDSFVTLTNEDCNLWGWENSVVIPNAQTFDCNIPSCLQSKQVIAVGRYTYQKGFDMLIEVWKYVVQKNREWKLIIVGEGELKDELEAQINNANVQDYVKLLPATNNIQEIYRESSILVMSSRYEGFGMVLLEAQTMGVPTISFDCKCGPSEIINNGKDGYLIKEGDVQDMSEKLLLLMENGDLRKEFGNNAFKNAKRFSENLIMQKWIELFGQVTGNVKR